MTGARAAVRQEAMIYAEELAARSGIARHQIKVWMRDIRERDARKAKRTRHAPGFDGQFTLHPFFEAAAQRRASTTARTQAQASDMDAYHALANLPTWTPERSLHAIVEWHGFAETCEALGVDRLVALAWVRAAKVPPEFVGRVLGEFAKLPVKARSSRGARHGTKREKIMAHSHMSLRAAAELLGVSPQTVMRVREQMKREARRGGG